MKHIFQKKQVLVLMVSVVLIVALLGAVFLHSAANPQNEDTAADTVSAKLQISGAVSVFLQETMAEQLPAYEDAYAGEWVDENGTLYWGVAGSEAYAEYATVLTESAVSDAVNAAKQECLSDEDAAVQAAIGSDAFCLVQQDYPLFYLRRVQKATEGHMVELGITAVGVSQKENRVRIALSDMGRKDTVLAFLEETCEGFDQAAVLWEQRDVSMAD